MSKNLKSFDKFCLIWLRMYSRGCGGGRVKCKILPNTHELALQFSTSVAEHSSRTGQLGEGSLLNWPRPLNLHGPNLPKAPPNTHSFSTFLPPKYSLSLFTVNLILLFRASFLIGYAEPSWSPHSTA